MFPAVQFYSSGRTVRLLSFEATGIAAASAAPLTFLDTLDEMRAVVGYGSLGKSGDLGFAFEGNRKVVVAGVSRMHSLSLHPPPNHDGKVSHTTAPLSSLSSLCVVVCDVFAAAFLFTVVRVCDVPARTAIRALGWLRCFA